MSTGDPHPSRIVGGGIDTGNTRQPVVVTQMLGVVNARTREEDLRTRFLSLDPLFDRSSNLVAHQLVLRGQIAGPDAAPELKQMDEDMLLAGLYSLLQDGVAGSLPLFVEIDSDILFSDALADLHHPRVVWRVDLNDERQMARALALQESGMNFCPRLNLAHPLLRESVAAWRYLTCRADVAPPPGARQLLVEDTAAAAHERWPAHTWFRHSTLPDEPSANGSSRVTAMQLELLALARGYSVDTLISFFRLNPEMAPRLLAIANSPAGGLSRPAESTGHALVMLGAQRACRVASLLALAGTRPDAQARHLAVTALTRALFMGKIVRLGAPAESAAAAFELGLLSIAPQALNVPPATIVRRLGVPATTARALMGQPSAAGGMLQLAHACEVNDADALAALASKLDLPLHQISVAYLDALIAASALDHALQ